MTDRLSDNRFFVSGMASLLKEHGRAKETLEEKLDQQKQGILLSGTCSYNKTNSFLK